jgi:C-terminal processing protease CtpA/Prc
VAAMGFLAHADALIVDLRDNHGGQPTMVQLILSYFFDTPTHLNDIYIRPDNTTRQYWTLPYVPGPRLIDTPLYVLTSKRTFSGAEEFTNDLKSQKRAAIVGERTRGGAHPLNTIPIGEHFVVGIPVGRPINPITHGDWEGTGVAPDVETVATDALEMAQKLATAKILADAKPH